MANNLDARPFVDLRKDGKEFKEKFDEDIEKIIAFLDAKISTLICDPDSFESPSRRTVKSSALVEFSKAKFEIFNNVKAVINQMEREWLKYISEMKKLFIENVEIFLAGTKLEVKLPTTEFQTSPNYRSSQKKDKSLIAESMRPIIPMFNTLAKNISVFGSPFGKTDNASDKRRNSRKFSKDSSLTSDSDSSEPDSDIEEERVSDASAEIPETMHKRGKEMQEVSVLVRKLPLKSPETKRQIRKQSTRYSSAATSSPVTDSSKEAQSSIESEIEPDSVTQSSSSKSGRSSKVVKPSNTPAVRRGRPPKKVHSTATSSPVTDSLKETVSSIESEIESDSVTQPSSSKSRRSSKVVKPSSSIIHPTARSGRFSKAVERSSRLQESSSTESETERAGIDSTLLNAISTQNGKTPAKTDKTGFSNVRSTRSRKTAAKLDKPASPKKSNLVTNTADSSSTRSPKKVSFTPMIDEEENIDVFAPVVRTKASLRRKTLFSNLNNAFSDIDLTPVTSRAKEKRKTIGGISVLTSPVPPKRLKANEKQKHASVSNAEEDDDLLEGNYSDWISLKSIDAKVPAKPGVYEVKVWRAKKPAYIGHCESVRQKLTLHKLLHNSGHKHLDKFLERNKDDIQIRFETFPTLAVAQAEAKNRVKNFVVQHHTTPAYN